MARTDNTINTSSSVTLLAGLWLIIAPFILNYSGLGVSATNEVILGIVVGILALISLTNHEMVWPAWVNLVLGLWLIISPFMLGYSAISQVIWNDIVLGIIVGASAITSAVNTTVSPQT
jgi:hypothetical protein